MSSVLLSCFAVFWVFITAAVNQSCICTFHLSMNQVRLSPCNSLAKAYVVLNDGYTLREGKLIKFCEQIVAPYKKIREVQFTSEMPKAPTGKTLEGCLEIKNWV
jgi:hypothetical protein